MFVIFPRKHGMYVLKQAYLKKINSEESYQFYDISRFTIQQILDSFVDGYFVLTHRQLKGTFYLSLENLRNSNVPLIPSLTLQDWFGVNSKSELKTSKKPILYKKGIVKYSDAVLAGYEITRIGRRMKKDANISNADKIDLLLEKNNVPKQDLYTKALFSVAGFVHRSFPHEGGVALANAGETFNMTKVNTVGVMSFKECGSLIQVELTEDMISNISPEVPLINTTMINSKQNLNNKCVFLVLAGHLIINSKVVEIVNFDQGFVKINTKELRVIDMILDSAGKINLDQIGVFTVGDMDATNYKVRYQDIISDVCIKQLFLIPQTFLVVVEADSIGMNRVATQTTGLPTVYEYHEEPIYPLMSSRGLLKEYWKRATTWGWLLKTYDDIEKFKMNETNLLENFNVLNNQGYRYRWYHDKPEFIQIETVTKLG